MLKLAYRYRAMFATLPPPLSLSLSLSLSLPLSLPHLQAELGLQFLAGELSPYVPSSLLTVVVFDQPGSDTENINNRTQKQHSTDCLHKLIDLIDH